MEDHQLDDKAAAETRLEAKLYRLEMMLSHLRGLMISVVILQFLILFLKAG